DPANPTAVGNSPTQCTLGLVGLPVSSPKLHPEKSTNYTFGLIFSPLESTKVSLDYWDIKVNQDIQSGVNVLFLGGDPALFPIVRGPQQVLPLVTAPGVLTPTPTPQGPVLYQAFPYFNLTQTHVNGLDLDFASHFDVGGAGRIPAALPAGLLGYCDVKAFTDVDLYAQYAFSKHLSVHAAILNVFDSQPPVDLETYGASGNDPYNPAMHQAGAIGRFYNLGASYTF